MYTNAFQIAHRFVGISEAPGAASNPHVLAMLRLDNEWPKGDDVPWCSAFVNYICWLLHLPRSKNLLARSWLRVGHPVDINDARPGYDVVILSRGSGSQPGPDVIDAPGHVGFFAGTDARRHTVDLLGGNQGDTIDVRPFPVKQVLGVRRLYGVEQHGAAG